MDEETRLRVIREVQRIGYDRFKAQGRSFNDADFAAGALAAMTALGLEPTQYPASWTFGLMFGRKSPFRQPPAGEES